MEILCCRLENPYDEKRVRFLEGKDLSPADLNKKIENVSPYPTEEVR